MFAVWRKGGKNVACYRQLVSICQMVPGGLSIQISGKTNTLNLIARALKPDFHPNQMLLLVALNLWWDIAVMYKTVQQEHIIGWREEDVHLGAGIKYKSGR